MRFFLINDRFTELEEWPTSLPPQGFLWVTCSRRVFEVQLTQVQRHLARLAGGSLVDLHISDLLNPQLPSQYDYTSWYDLLVFRRLAAGPGTAHLFLDDEHGMSVPPEMEASPSIPPQDEEDDHLSADAALIHEQGLEGHLHRTEGRGPSRLPPSPADLMLRIVNHMVDSYLDLRRLLTRQLGYLQQDMLRNNEQFRHWQALLESRNTLHLLEDTCEDQHSALQEWMDALDEWPVPTDPQAAREREVLRVRSRDVQEHIERVLNHVRRLESSSESAVQMHFSLQGSRTNDIMRTLTVLTAVFLPLNLITGVFGMNFDAMPLIHTAPGFWVAMMLMGAVVVGLVWWFRRQRYLGG